MLAALVLLALVGGWQLYADLGGIDPILLPSPTDIAASLWDDRALLWSQFLVTAEEMVLGLLAAAAIGVLLALLLHVSRTLRRAVYPLLVGSQTIPVVIVAPLLVVWFGYDLGPKVLIVALVCFFPLVVPTLDALDGTPAARDRVLRTLGASRWQRLRFAELPAAVPGLLTGARLAVAVSAIAAVLAEQSGSSAGLGHLIAQAIPQLDTARAWAAVVVLSVFAILLFTALSVAERRLVPWSHRTRGSRP
jgi:ABC-type nitrate/sulfonate/bicarbonate transport system permease component